MIRTQNMRLVLDDLKADLLGQSIGSAYGDGVSRADINLRRWNPDAPKEGVVSGDAFSLSGTGSTGVGVFGSRYLHEASCDLPDGVMLIPL